MTRRINQVSVCSVILLLVVGPCLGGCQKHQMGSKGLQCHTVEQIIDRKNVSNPKLLQSLATSGDNLNKPREIDHTLYAYSESDKTAACSELKEQGFSIDDGTNVDGSYWIDATIVQTPQEAASPEFVHKLAVLCVNHKCDYDGWGTHITK
jgi:hypothetical protein